MALDRNAAEVLLLLKEKGLPCGSVLMLGRQHFVVPPHEVAANRRLAEIAVQAPEMLEEGERYADGFLRGLGASDVRSMDASDYQGAGLIHDLNQPIPEDWHEQFDVVFDGGTLEHIFHFPNAIRNVMHLVRKNGCFVTCTMSNNYNGHGFYQFSAELFFRTFNAANGFRILLMAHSEIRLGGRRFRIADPEKLGRRVSFQGTGPLMLIMVAQRTEIGPLFDKLPQQSDYTETWASEGDKENANGAGSPASGGAAIKKRLRRLFPAPFLDYYDTRQVEKRLKREQNAGVLRVDTLEKCLLDSDVTSGS